MRNTARVIGIVIMGSLMAGCASMKASRAGELDALRSQVEETNAAVQRLGGRLDAVESSQQEIRERLDALTRQHRERKAAPVQDEK